jgi:outer membrane lipoprotein SlyB
MSDTQDRIVGVLPTASALQSVIDTLETEGFDRSQFGVLAKEESLAGGASAAALAEAPGTPTEADAYPETEGALTGALVGGLAYLGAMVAAGAVVLTGGGLGLALAAIIGAGGAGGLTGALVAHGFQEDHAKFIEDQLALGGLLLWIQPRDAAQAGTARARLEAAGATKVLTQTPE